MMDAANEEMDATTPIKVHLLDVGPDEYGDAVLCQLGHRSILIDGAHPGDHTGREGHPSIPDQLAELLDQEAPYRVDLLVVTHAHQDHIGCLPQLVARDLLRADWALVADSQLGWGRAEGEDRDSESRDEQVLALSAALREEIRTARTSDGTLAEFIDAARTLEERYKQMLDTLEERGTHVVRLGQQSTERLVEEFSDVGLRVLGPSQNHLVTCAEIINQLSRDAAERAADLLRRDAAADVASVYRRLVGTGLDAMDVQRPGPAINLQSIVTQFKYRGHKFLFAGDMQFAKSEVDNAALETSVRRLRRRISQDSPYSFYKLSHHGSYNAFDEEIFDELGGTPLYGMCAGQHSTHHPNRKVLAVLDEHRRDIQWARTDRNGLVTITFGAGEPQIKRSKGRLNDAEPNDVDVTATSRPAPPELTSGGAELTAVSPSTPQRRTAPSIPVKATTAVQAESSSEAIEISAKIPHVATRVTFTIDVEPRDPSARSTATSQRAQTTSTGEAQPADAIRIAGGRALPDLLFVTSGQALVDNIGQAETSQLIDAFRRQNRLLHADLPRGMASSTNAAGLIREQLQRYPQAQGVVIIGGYDVVPAQILDCLPRELRQGLPGNDDPDRFVVWSDDVYGDRDGDGLPEVPVSRIPDGKSAALVFKALQAGGDTTNGRRAGVRNVARPFARAIFEALPGAGSLLTSKMTVFNQNPAVDLRADQIYFMLHGDYVDGSRFWGEGTPHNIEAVNISNIPADFKGVVFTGCCWGALTVDTPAGLVTPDRPFGQRTPESSMALSFLARGATAFIGCTGAHYSPTESPYNYFGGPMHAAFWRNYNAGRPPAQSLFDAKVEYVEGMPHGRSGPLQMAIEYKILRQYTCLGLGW